MESERTIQELVTSVLKMLKLQEAELTVHLKRQSRTKKKEDKELPRHKATIPARHELQRDGQSFCRGDRIWIKSRLHKPANWNKKFEWSKKEGKTATVMEVVMTRGPGEQVHFLTDNGVRTW